MNPLHLISLLSWIAMWLAFHFGHPAGYVVAILGFASSVAIAHESEGPAAANEERAPKEALPRPAKGAAPRPYGKLEGDTEQATKDDLPRAA